MVGGSNPSSGTNFRPNQTLDLSGFDPIVSMAGDDNLNAMSDAASISVQRIKRHARRRLLRTLYAALGVGMVSALAVAAVIYWLYQAGRFRP